MYNVILSNKVLKQLDKIEKEIYLRIYKRLKTLAENPRPNGSIKLTDLEDYRIRIGDFRILYQILDNEKEIRIFEILDRKEAYKKR